MSTNLYPDFEYDESNVGARPVRSAAVDRIGMAGEFTRGPLSAQVVNKTTAEQIYAYDTKAGSVNLQGMVDQGANDFVVSRALGQAVAASLAATISGTVVGAGSLAAHLKDGGTTTDVTISLTDGETASTVTSALVAAIVATAGTTITAAVGSGNTGTSGHLTFNAKTAGVGGNSLQVEFTLTTSTGLTFTGANGSTFTSLAGGVDGPKAASLILLDAADAHQSVLTLNWPGALGNDVTCVVAVGSEPTLRDLTIGFPGSGLPDEVYHDVDFTDVFQETRLVAFNRSLIGVVANVVDNTLVPAAGTYAFTGGGDGPTLTTSDFITAIDALALQQCTIICCPGLKPAGVDQLALDTVVVTQAESLEANGGELAGLRIAVISTPRGTTIADLAVLKAGNRIPDSKRCVMVVGWATLARQPKYKRFGVDPAALYAGHLVVTPRHVSPAARTSSPFIQGITEVDTPDQSGWNDITRARLDAIIVDPEFGGYHMLNGRSTSNDPAWYWICYRRIYDKIRTNVRFGLAHIKSEPEDPSHDLDVEDTTNSALQESMYAGEIRGFDPAISNDANNPPAVRGAGERIIDFKIELIPPNDKTRIRMGRTVQAQIRL